MCSEIIYIALSYECVTKNPPPGLMMLNITAYFVATTSYSSVRNRDLFGSKRTSQVFSLFMALIMQNMATAISHKFNFINQRNDLNHQKEQEKLVTQLIFRAVGQNHAEWQTFEQYENKRQCSQPKSWFHLRDI